LWTSGTLRCILVTHFEPAHHAVLVFDRDQRVVTERVADPEEAARVAERLWDRLVNRST